MSRLSRFGTLYSLTFTWLAGAALAVAVSRGWIKIGAGVAVLAIVCLILLQVSCRRELAVVRHLVDAQHDELVSRIDQLTGALERAGVPVPPRAALP